MNNLTNVRELTDLELLGSIIDMGNKLQLLNSQYSILISEYNRRKAEVEKINKTEQ